MTLPYDEPRGIYIAGPMSDLPEFNYPAFYAASDALVARGYPRVVNPAALGDGSTGKSWPFYMRQGIAGLLTCNAVALLPGWEASRGATLEATIAKQLDMRVMLLAEWLEATP